MKRLFTLVLTIAMFCSTVLTAQAADISTEPMNQIPVADQIALREALSIAEPIKAEFGLSAVDFSQITVGKAIQAYEYLPTGLEELLVAYPLFYQDDLIALALDAGTGNYQIATYFAEYLSSLVLSNIALIYDSQSCRAFNGKNLFTLYSGNFGTDWRATISDNNTAFLNNEDIVLAELKPVCSLNYVTNTYNLNAVNADYYTCSVGFVTQIIDGNDNLCWAATSAMIINKLKGTNLNAVQVAQVLHGTTNYDRSATGLQIASLLTNNYSLYYSWRNFAPGETDILNNISQGYPIAGFFAYSTGSTGHYMCINSIHTAQNYIAVKDPLFTYDTVTICSFSNGRYRGVNASGTPLSLVGMVSKV